MTDTNAIMKEIHKTREFHYNNKYISIWLNFDYK